MSFWPFGQNTSSALNINRLLDEYYYQRSVHGQEQDKERQESGEVNGSSGINGSNASNGVSEGDVDADAEGDDLDVHNVVIDRDFVYQVLDDSSLLTELGRQNNKLIDFICFGYINDNDQDDDQIQIQDQDQDQEMKDDQPQLNHPQHQQGTAVLEILLDIILDSVEWFKENESQSNKMSDDSMFDDDGNDDDGDPINQLALVFNRIHAASEILSCKIWLISETLVEEPSLLNKLWSFLSNDFETTSSPSIPLFIKINEQLLLSRPDQMLNFIRSQENLVDNFLKHINITMIMDFLLKIITTDKPDMPTGIIDLLSEQQLIPKILNFLQSSQDSALQSSCGDFLKALIAISANTSIDEHTIGPNLLTKELVNDDNIDKIIEIILQKGNGLATAVGVIIEIIRKNNSDYDTVNLLYTTTESNPPNKRDSIYLGGMLKKFSLNLNNFQKILVDPKLTSKRIENQINQEIEPLGFERFKICELIAELLHCSNISLLNNHLTEKIIAEREAFLRHQEDNLQNALSEALIDTSITSTTLAPSPGSAQFNGFSNLNIGGTSEPSVALSSKNITISPHQQTEIEPMTPINEELLDDNDDKQQENSSSHQLPQHQFPVMTKREQLRSNPTVGDFFKINLVDSKIIQTILKMFIKFPWNNFWHNVVFDIVQQIFNGRLDISYNPYLILELFEKSDITNLIIDAYNLCITTEQTTKVRLGYMGHLILIAEEVVKFSSIFQNSKFNDLEVDELIYLKLIDPQWINYVTNILTETREMYNCVLGGIKNDEFNESNYLNSKAIILGNSEEEILNQVPEEQQEQQDDQEQEQEQEQDPKDEDFL
ncbi:SIT4-associating protein [Wickerhamomyces ciferrii]|uniref:SIT4-associating protein n=1 Tax=Wickerhamomyces ciferrii (strain ATCC 14091 / BCRC 22168 / CBS 111 / JCM 3599 / NBRC 0793 / NRRL Y-1031 F-60-10) TaxID=1206466 RepID=K0KGK8_WICCF|nr:SIT4-associating protein [Wickerhamomyces ciferrii]CCH42116.1 SIT4-associating protein [Wickerhamomyces ciferrii]